MGIRHIRRNLAVVISVVLVAGAGALAWVYLVPPPPSMPHGDAAGIRAEQTAPPPEEKATTGAQRPAPINFSSMGPIHNAEMRFAFFTPASVLWEFGDGKTSTERDPVHRYEKPGAYTVTVTITSTDGTKHVEGRTITVR